jgi:hypothetical protein
MKLQVLFVVISFITSEILPFFPSIESNGIVHSIITNLPLTKKLIEQTTNEDLDNDGFIGPTCVNDNDTDNYRTVIFNDTQYNIYCTVKLVN